MSRTSVGSIFKIIQRESRSTEINLAQVGIRTFFLLPLERKLDRDAKTVVNDLAKSRIVVLKKTLTGPLQIKTILLYKSLHHPLESTEDNSGERLYVLDRGDRGGGPLRITTQRTQSPQWWEYYAWGCFSARTGNLVKVEGITNKRFRENKIKP